MTSVMPCSPARPFRAAIDSGSCPSPVKDRLARSATRSASRSVTVDKCTLMNDEVALSSGRSADTLVPLRTTGTEATHRERSPTAVDAGGVARTRRRPARVAMSRLLPAGATVPKTRRPRCVQSSGSFGGDITRTPSTPSSRAALMPSDLTARPQKGNGASVDPARGRVVHHLARRRRRFRRRRVQECLRTCRVYSVSAFQVIGFAPSSHGL